MWVALIIYYLNNKQQIILWWYKGFAVKNSTKEIKSLNNYTDQDYLKNKLLSPNRGNKRNKIDLSIKNSSFLDLFKEQNFKIQWNLFTLRIKRVIYIQGYKSLIATFTLWHFPKNIDKEPE